MSAHGSLLTYNAGKVIFNDQFKSLPELVAAKPLFAGSKDKAQDIGSYLFFVHDPRSAYAKAPEEERLKRCIIDKRYRDAVWLESIIDDPLMKALVDVYRDISLTPAMKLHRSMIEAINRYIKEIADAKGTDMDVNMDKLLERGISLFERLKEVERVLNEEAIKKIRAGYAPKMFERSID